MAERKKKTTVVEPQGVKVKTTLGAASILKRCPSCMHFLPPEVYETHQRDGCGKVTIHIGGA